MKAVFPKFVSSDPELNLTYDYRCELYNRHVKETPEGHVITEFLPNVGWAGIYNTISCAASHHFRDGRWMSTPPSGVPQAIPACIAFPFPTVSSPTPV